MINKLNEYLILNEKADLPGIGIFSIEHEPAKFDFINKALYAPLPVIRFGSGVAEADKHFFNFISNGLEEYEVASARRFNDLIFDIKHKLSYNGEVVLKDLGTLKKDSGDIYSFEQKFPADDFFPAVYAERVMRSNAKHIVKSGDHEHTNIEMQELLAEEKPVKDYWWVYAVILTVIGVAALMYYYFNLAE